MALCLGLVWVCNPNAAGTVDGGKSADKWATFAKKQFIEIVKGNKILFASKKPMLIFDNVLVAVLGKRVKDFSDASSALDDAVRFSRCNNILAELRKKAPSCLMAATLGTIAGAPAGASAAGGAGSDGSGAGAGGDGGEAGAGGGGGGGANDAALGRALAMISEAMSKGTNVTLTQADNIFKLAVLPADYNESASDALDLDALIGFAPGHE